MKTDLVVAVYNENLAWLRNRKFDNEKVFAYAKFERFDFDFVEKLPNIGRESHTYIWHILKNYEKIESDYTLFLQGDPFVHISSKMDSVSNCIFNNNYDLKHLFYPLGGAVICDAMGKPFSNWDCKIYRIWDELFCYDMPQYFVANYGAQQIVHNSLIAHRSKKFWEKALDLHYEYESAAPWAFEILWNYVFDPRFISAY